MMKVMTGTILVCSGGGKVHSEPLNNRSVDLATAQEVASSVSHLLTPHWCTTVIFYTPREDGKERMAGHAFGRRNGGTWSWSTDGYHPD